MTTEPFDIAIVGAGFSGSVLAERFAHAGRRVVLIEQRNHVGGNAFDYYDSNGILVHKYGPHIFHTNHVGIIEYLSQFTEWRPYEHRVLSAVDGQLVPVPVNLTTIELLYGPEASARGMEAFLTQVRVDVGIIRNAEDSVVARMGRDLYERIFKGYTEKQWGRSAKRLSPTVTSRIPVRHNYDDRYFTDRYQLMPANGYTAMFQKMVAHCGIHILLQTPWQDVKDLHLAPKVIFTGPIDLYFGYALGRLPYRSLKFDLQLHYRERVQRVGTINYPSAEKFTRVTEFKHLTGQEHPYTVTATEYPRSTGDPYYPIPAPENEERLRLYKAEAEKLPNVRFAGRLGSYRYYNMDQVVGQALSLFAKLVNEGW